MRSIFLSALAGLLQSFSLCSRALEVLIADYAKNVRGNKILLRYAIHLKSFGKIAFSER
jgi:hypothetical protein